MVKNFLAYLSFFNFNLDLTAPECSIPHITFSRKWVFTMLLPLAAGSLFLLMHILVYLKKRVILRRTKNLNNHVDVLIGMFLTMFYFLYLYLTRSVLDIFNCSPTDPPDGKLYLQVG